MEIRTRKGEALDLQRGFSLEIQDTNPIYNDRGSQSLPATIPATQRNCRLTSFPTRLDTSTPPGTQLAEGTVVDGVYIRRGKINVNSASKKDGISLNFGFDNSTEYQRWNNKKLPELDGLPTLVFRSATSQDTPQEQLMAQLRGTYHLGDERDEYAIFPVAVNNEELEGEEDAVTHERPKSKYWELLNLPQFMEGRNAPTTVKRIVDGKLTDISIPECYGVTPFLKVWRVLELIFADAGYAMEGNPFYEDAELTRLVVLNNAADVCCLGRVKYSELMPDVTVDEFMNALWVRFGLVYQLDATTRRVSLRFIKDIIKEPPARDIDGSITDRPLITYLAAQYVKLSAKSSFDGAEPATERFEDFARGYDIGAVRIGSDVNSWRYNDTMNDWDYDIDQMDFDPVPLDPSDPDYPEPDDDRFQNVDERDEYDDRDYDDDRSYMMRRSRRLNVASKQQQAASDEEDGFDDAKQKILSYETRTGNWFKLDNANGIVKQSSSSFFNWDPKSEGLEALDLESVDEWVPLGRANDEALNFHDLVPMYLAGSRHYHSYIKNTEDSDNANGVTTPLAFAFAFCRSSEAPEATIGRFSPESANGTKITIGNAKPTLSLLFQFKNGLFDRFWKGYDEILRHGNRQVEVEMVSSKPEVLKIDMLKPLRLEGINCLVDMMTYNLPAPENMKVAMQLRTILPQGKYDIVAEQSIPRIEIGETYWKWVFISDNFAEATQDDQLLSRAMAIYRQEHPGFAGKAELAKAERLMPTWETDSRWWQPTTSGATAVPTYKARCTFNIYRLITSGNYGDPNYSESFSPMPVDSLQLITEYRVRLIAKKVYR